MAIRSPLVIESAFGDHGSAQAHIQLAENRPSSADQQTAIAYYKKVLGGELPQLCMPTTKVRPSILSSRHAVASQLLSVDIVEPLSQLAQSTGATDQAIYLAAFYALLFRYTQQEDIVLGVLSGQSARSEVIAPAAPQLIVRPRLAGLVPFTALLRHVNEELTMAPAGPVPLDALVPQLKVAEDKSRHPIFQALFALRPAHDGTGMDEHELLASALDGASPPEIALILTTTSAAGGLRASLVYSFEVFKPDAMAKMLENFCVLLEGIGEAPQSLVAHLPVLPLTERLQLLVEWNDSLASPARFTCAHEYVEENAANTPDAIALAFESQLLTYKDLNRRANQLAYYLRSLAVGPEVLVGLYVERSIEGVVGMLAVLKAGGAFVPLDPTYPQERIAFMLADSRPAVLLTQTRLLSSLPPTGADVLCLDSESGKWAEQPATDLPCVIGARHLAYVIYTSGSTGKPKGALLEHRGLCNLIEAQCRTFDLQASDRVLQVARLSFDASISEIFMALFAGARLHLAAQDQLLPGPGLAQLMEGAGITMVTMTPTALAVVPLRPLPALRTLIVAGEACPAGLMQKWAPGRRVFNAYGPTEITVCATIAECDPAMAQPPIGRPIANVQVYVLDAYAQPVPTGVAGELYVGGIGVGRGYLNRPELNAERFIPSPFRLGPDERLYRTGDMVKWLPDGNLYYLGRADQQVKVRGIRIELGEIEATLCRHPAIQEAVVVSREDPRGKRLVAYAVTRRQPPPAAAQLRTFLAAHLPEFMLPADFVWLEALPRTPSDKVDRRALPAPDWADVAQVSACTAPRGDLEQLVAGFFAETLGLSQVGADDNFFVRGGDSLVAARLLSRLYEVFDVEVSLGALFTAPTPALLAVAVEKLRSAGVRSVVAPLKPARRDQPLPASFNQQQLWLLAQNAPEVPNYNETLVLAVSGTLDFHILERALQALIQRHEALRTAFAMVEGRLLQVIADDAFLALNLVDLRDQPQSTRSTLAVRLAVAEARRPFDLRRPLLLRATLVQLGEQEYRFYLTIHHIIADGVSLYSVFCQDLGAIYLNMLTGQSGALPPLPLQYADFAVWQRQELTQEFLAPHLAYWKRQLAGLPLLNLPTDRPRPTLQSFHGAKYYATIPGPVLDGLQALCRSSGVTLFMGMISALAILLQRYTGQDDIVIGTVLAGRARPELAPLLGYFLNTVALRPDLTGNPTLLALLARVRELALDAQAHQDVPLELLAGELQLPRAGNRNPLFQIAFTVEPPLTAYDPRYIEVSDLDNGTAKFDLLIGLEARPEQCILRLEYDTDLFERSTIARMVEHLQALIESIIASPQTPIAELSLLRPAERQQILGDWNATAAPYADKACIHELVAAQAAQTPHHPALLWEGQTLSYQELERRANQLAHLLRRLGIGAEVPVALCIERSFDMVIAILAILKAGGAFVPIDPSYAAPRMAYILQDSGAPLLLTTTGIAESLPAFTIQRLYLDTVQAALCMERDEPLAQSATADSLAYVIYTSGSTGRPKGVMIEHRGVCNLAAAQKARFAVQPEDRVLQFSSLGFDAAVWEIFMALTAGATLCLASRESLLPGTPLLQTLNEQAVSVVTLVPSVLSRLPPERLPALRTLIVAGEACSQDLVGRWAPGRAFFNAYGPTETTVCATIAQCDSAALPVTIGTPILNTRCYVLDFQDRLCPIGVPGELCIGGVGLARGYLNQPELTAAKFVADPFATDPHARLYRTGDRARFAPDGSIEFLGRVDRQVKLRGFRIELGEIETVLGEHQGVRAACVMVREPPAGDKYLAAYVVPAVTQLASELAPELRSFLRSRLPEYMVPFRYTFLAELPLSHSGKVDYHALPEPQPEPDQAPPPSLPPHGPLQERIAAVWVSVLGIKRIGRKDRFFELGGNSLLAVQLITRLNEVLGTALPVKSIFENQTIEALAQLVSTLAHNDYQAPSLNLRAEAILPPDIMPQTQATPGAAPQQILLTGATGYLGAYLLHELLTQTSAQILCLVRAPGVEQAAQRLRTTLLQYALWDPRFYARIIPVVGDLGQPLLGLAPTQFDVLAQQVDSIYHCGALVHFLHPYSSLKAPNVLGTQEILRLACRGNSPTVHYISTGAVFGASGYFTGQTVISEDAALDPVADYLHVDFGYIQSKWVAEQLVWQAAARGLSVTVSRVGFVMCHSQTGAANTKDLLSLLIKGCAQIGAFPTLRGKKEELITVDYASRAIVHLARQPESVGKAFHITPAGKNLTLADVFSLVSKHGYQVEPVTYQSWRERILQHGQRNALYSLLPLLTEKVQGELTLFELYQDTPDYDCANTIQALASADIPCTEVDAPLMGRFLGYLTSSGFLEPPASASAAPLGSAAGAA